MNANNKLSSRRSSLRISMTTCPFPRLPVVSPRSAGQHAEPKPLRVPHKLESKYSPLNLSRSPWSSWVDPPNSPLEHTRMRVKTQPTPHLQLLLHFLVSPPHRVVPKAGSAGVLIGMGEGEGEDDGELVDGETCICTPCCGRYREHPRSSPYASLTLSLPPTISPDSATVSTSQAFPFGTDCPPPADISLVYNILRIYHIIMLYLRF
jgi:hypothetical protein